MDSPDSKPSLEGLLTNLLSEFRELKADLQEVKAKQIALESTKPRIPTASVSPHSAQPTTESIRAVTAGTRCALDDPEMWEKTYGPVVGFDRLRVPDA
jgi:hypothetical protein